jgi:hypothetical protein
VYPGALAAGILPQYNTRVDINVSLSKHTYIQSIFYGQLKMNERIHFL